MVWMERPYRSDELQVMSGIAVQDAARSCGGSYSDNEDTAYRGVPSRTLFTEAASVTVESYVDEEAQTVRMRIYWRIGDADGVTERIVRMSGDYQAWRGYDAAFDPVVGALLSIVVDGVIPTV